MIETLRLPLDFDPDALLRDLERVPDDLWTAHVNRNDYEGDWSGVALRGQAGATHPILQLTAHPGIDEWEDTDLMGTCSYFAEVASRFACPLQGVRLLRLAPGSIITEHSDLGLGLEDGEARIHVPIQTSPDVEFWLNSHRVELHAGETWYLNVSLPHRVTNNSSEPRVHLILDCIVDDWLRDLFRKAEELAPRASE